jgi:hypothetical protein
MIIGAPLRKAVLGMAVVVAVALISGGCMRSRKPIGVPLVSTARFESELRKYASFGLRKSLALAGDPHGAYVLGYGHALADEEDAVARALADCDLRRRDRRIGDPCRTIAIDNELLEGNPFAAF